MRAVRITAWQAPPTLEELPKPAPRDREVLVRVGAAGLCSSDLHVMSTAEGILDYALPMTLGHEVAGVVESVGSQADQDLIGATVVVYGIASCGHCKNCRRGRDNYCVEFGFGESGLRPVGVGLGRNGGLADYVLLPDERNAVRADGLDPVVLAPLADAGLTAYHAVASLGGVLDDSEGVAIVIGVGGLGHLAIQILKATTPATVVAVDSKMSGVELARECGADFVTSVPADAAAFCAAEGRGGADAVLDFVGSDDTLAQAGRCLARGGHLAIVGGAGGSINASKSPSLPGGWHLNAPFWGTRDDLCAVVGLARSGALLPRVTEFSLADALEAYELLRAGRVSGRAVVRL